MEAMQTQTSAVRRGWSTLKEAFAGSEQDFTEGSLVRAVRAARGAHDPRDVDGVRLRRAGRVLRGPAGPLRGGGGRAHRGHGGPRVRGGHGPQPLHDRHGRAPDRREGPGGRVADRGAGHRPRPAGRDPHRRRRHRLRARAAGAHGGTGGRGQGRRRLHRVDPGRQRHHPAAVPDQRDLPRRGRRVPRHALALARQPRERGARPLPDLRPGPVPRAGPRGCRHRHHRRAAPWASSTSSARSPRDRASWSRAATSACSGT